MALRIRFQYATGSLLGYSVERLSDGTFLDFNDLTFKVSPTTLVTAIPEDTGSFSGRYKATLTTTPASQFTNGDYVITIHNLASNYAVVSELACVMYNGNDTTVIPGSSGGSDPWATTLPGGYQSGTAGSILGSYLDAKVSTRSTYSGGAVASVMSPVTVGSNNDKTGYVLASNGFDGIQIESGVNARQALAPILAASAGVLIGAGTGTVVVKGGNVAVTRITASTDNAGNRTSVTLSLPQ